MGRRKGISKVGDRYWANYKPKKQRLYQLQEYVNAYGGMRPLSPWMTSAKRKTFISNWRESGTRKKIPPTTKTY